MADSRVLIEIISTAKGLKVVAKDTEKLAKNVDKVDKAQGKADKSGGKYHKQQKAIHQSNLSSAKGFSKMNETMGSGGSSGLVGAYATLAANVFAATAAFNALRGAAQVETLVEGFTFLADTAGRTSTIISNNIREITGNALSMEQAMRSSAIAITSGFSTEQFERLVEVGKNASIALGRNLADSVDRLTRGVAKLEPEILDELGILVRLDTATREYAAAIGKTATDLTDFERRQAFLNATIEQGEEKYSALSGSIDVNAFDKLAGTFANLTHNLLEFINVGLKPFIAFFANSQIAMFGAITFLAKGIISTMFPVLTDLGNRFANTAARSKEAANAMKDDTQKAFEKLQGGLGERGTKKGDPAGFQSLAAAAKKGTVDTKKLNAAMKSLSISETLRKNNLDKDGVKDKKRKTAELKRIRDLKKEVLELMKAEKARAGASKGQVAAAGKASRQGIIAEGATAIGGSSGIGGIGVAIKSMGKLNQEINATNSNMISSFGGGKMKKIGLGISGGFKLASGGVRLFGAALINAIPLFGQLVFAFGVAKTIYEKFFGMNQKLKAAFDQLSTTLEGQIDKYLTLEIVVGNLSAKQLELETESIASANAIVKNQNAFKIARLEAIKYTSEVKVTAGVLTELADSLDKFAKGLLDVSVTEADVAKQQADIDFKNTYGLDNTVTNRILVFLGRLGAAQNGVNLENEIAKVKAEQLSKAVGDQSNNFEFFGDKAKALFDTMQTEGTPAFQKLTKEVGGKQGLSKKIEEVGKMNISLAAKMAIVNKLFKDAALAANQQNAAIESLGPGFSELTKKVTAFADKGKKSNPFITLGQDIDGFEKKLKELVKQELAAADTAAQGLASAQSLLTTIIPADALETFKSLGITFEGIKGSLGEMVDEQGEFKEVGESVVGVAARELNEHGLAVETLKEKLAVLKANLEIQKKSVTTAILQNEIDLKNATLERTGTFKFTPEDEIKQAQFISKTKKELVMEELKNKNEAAIRAHVVQMGNIENENIGNQNKIDTLKAAEKAAFQERLIQLGIEADTTTKTLEKARLDAMSKAGTKGTTNERLDSLNAARDGTEGFQQKVTDMQNAAQPMLDTLKSLGPDGEFAAAAISGTLSIAKSIETIGTAGFKSAEGLEAMGSIVGQVGSIMAAQSKANIAEVDKQIQAEKNRDGKSKESLAKIAAMEKKKEQMERKAFERNKQMQIAETIINTASAVMKASPNIPMMLLMGAMGIAQLAVIQKTQFQGGGSADIPKPAQSIGIGKRDNKVDTSRAVTTGELAYLRGARGVGSNANNFTPGGAAGMRRGYSAGGEILVGEQGPEVIQPTSSGFNVVPNDKMGGQNLNANITINAVDAAGVEEVLMGQRGNIIGMIREAAHENGEEFIEAVNTSSYGSAGGDGGY